MNINFNYALKKGLYPEDVLSLLLIKYASYKENYPESFITSAANSSKLVNIAPYVKVSKDGALSLNKDGTKLLSELTLAKEDLKTAEDEALVQYIVDYCNKNPEYIVGNKKQIIRSLINLRLATDFTTSQLFTIMQHFLASEDSNYFLKFEYLFWKPHGPYDKRFSLENSRLYNHYEKYRAELDKVL